MLGDVSVSVLAGAGSSPVASDTASDSGIPASSGSAAARKSSTVSRRRLASYPNERSTIAFNSADKPDTARGLLRNAETETPAARRHSTAPS